MYYTVKTIDPQGAVNIQTKINHLEAIATINNLLLSYGFNKEISKNTFNNIITRPVLLPERVKYLINNLKLSVERHNLPPPLKKDILEKLNNRAI